jgi:hypothetical protein
MKASKATVRARVDDILRVIVDGAEPWQIGPYVAEQEQAGAAPWTVPDGGKPLSRRQIRRYVSWAERLMAASPRTDREKLLRKHEAQRRNLYARAVNKGDERTALAVLQDLAKMQDLYPPAKLKAEHTGAQGGPIAHKVDADHEHHIDADPDRLAAILRALADASQGIAGAADPAGDPPADEVHPAQAPPQAGGLPPAQLS